MNIILADLSHVSLSLLSAGWLFNQLVKSVQLLLPAFFITFLMRSVSAALRHWVWALAFIGLLLFPPLSIFLPRKDLPLLPDKVTPGSRIESAFLSDLSPEQVDLRQRRRTADLTRSDRSSSAAIGAVRDAAPERGLEAPTVDPEPGFSLQGLLTAVWLGGFLVMLLRFAWNLIRLHRIAKTGRSLSRDELRAALEYGPGKDGFGRLPRCISHHRMPAPATFGLFRPILLVPGEFRHWPLIRRRTVIYHELAHIKRHDYAFNLAAQAACALHWFNPLVWIALRRFWDEREKACDDCVLRHGFSDTEYAESLLAVARELTRGIPFRNFASVLAPKTKLKRRLLHILTPEIHRNSLSRRALAFSLGIVSLVLIPLTVASIQARQSRRRDMVPVYRKSLAQLKDDLAGGDTGRRLSAAWALGERENAAAVPDLIEALRNDHPEVRGMAAWALGEIKEPSSLIPLIEAFSERNPRAREMMARAAGEFEDRRAAAPLALLLEDGSIDVRIAAIWALGEVRGSEALAAILTAADDPAPQVRAMAAVALTGFQSSQAERALMSLLEDKKPEVRIRSAQALAVSGTVRSVPSLLEALRSHDARLRACAATALGSIGDPGAVETLIEALRDDARDVRAQAVWALDEINPSRDPRFKH